MKNANQGTPAQLNGKGLRIGVIRARFNDDITSSLSRACHGELQTLGVAAEDIEEFTVPGALAVLFNLARNLTPFLFAAFCFVEFVGGEHHSATRSGELADDGANGVAAIHIDARGGFVEEGNLGYGSQSESERQTLTLTTREARDVTMRKVRNVETLEHPAHDGAIVITGRPKCAPVGGPS